ncbi:MAG: ComF family protein [Balneolaceae bacterium]
MKEKLTRFIQPVTDVAFPPVCACCGEMLMKRDDVICDECLEYRFEQDGAGDDVLLPDTVGFRFSMWQFDKMGYLQDLLHKLKYDHVTGVGFRLGQQVGRALIGSGFFHDPGNSIWIPVPLHKKRLRKRGYNQSRMIADGLASVTGIEVIAEDVVSRVKRTHTQTGLNSGERIKNLNGAFQVNKGEAVAGQTAIIVDDVFTTGATTFELAGVLSKASDTPCGIVTIART